MKHRGFFIYYNKTFKFLVCMRPENSSTNTYINSDGVVSHNDASESWLETLGDCTKAISTYYDRIHDVELRRLRSRVMYAQKDLVKFLENSKEPTDE